MSMTGSGVQIGGFNPQDIPEPVYPNQGYLDLYWKAWELAFDHVKTQSGLPIVALARDDQQFNAETGNYWKGGVWMPTSYMSIKALENTGTLPTDSIL